MTLIADARVLREGWVPSDLRYRSGTLDALSTVLSGLSIGEACAFLHGPPGAGKTVCAEFIVQQLLKEQPEIAYAHIQASTIDSRWAMLVEILDDVKSVVGMHRQSTSHHDLLERLREIETPVVVVLDEVDALPDYDCLADLLSVKQNLGLILIANDENDFQSALPPRIQSRVQSRCQSLAVDSYSTTELAGILDDRVRHGLGRDVITDEQVVHIADQAGGDARLAIATLRKAAIRAQDKGRDRITDGDIEFAFPEARKQVRKTSLSKLAPDQVLLYRLIYEHGPIQAGDLHDRYEAESQSPVSKRRRRQFLAKLGDYRLIESDGENRWRIYSVREPAPNPM